MIEKITKGDQVEVLSPDRYSYLNGHNWNENIPCPMSKPDMEAYQAKLDDILGTEPGNHPRMRLIWGMDLEKAIIWDVYHREYRPTYPADCKTTYVTNPATGINEPRRKWIGIPRLFLEAWVPAVHKPGGTDSFVVDQEELTYEDEPGKLKKQVTKQVVGENKTANQGKYVLATPIFQHSMLVDESGWKKCCLERILEGKKCWGNYREPDEFDLEQIQVGMTERMSALQSRPDQGLTDDDKRLCYMQMVRDSMKNFHMHNLERQYRRRDTMKTIGHWWEGMPGKKNRISY